MFYERLVITVEKPKNVLLAQVSFIYINLNTAVPSKTLWFALFKQPNEG